MPGALTEPVYERTFASREPFWAELSRGDTAYEVYLLNDRGGIYALGYPETSLLGHLVNLAELIALGFVTMLLLLFAGALYGLIAARTPASGCDSGSMPMARMKFIVCAIWSASVS